MDKADFKEDTRYTVTWRDENGKARPGNIYVFRTYADFMIVRETSGGGLLRKIPYGDILKIVQEKAVDKHDRYVIPAAVLEEKAWRDRSVMERYSTAPQFGK
ncbi:MAG: hypothetical protein ACOZDY_01525 [Pseudomonadota bacterium]